MMGVPKCDDCYSFRVTSIISSRATWNLGCLVADEKRRQLQEVAL